jgi:hypothetical protein
LWVCGNLNFPEFFSLDRIIFEFSNVIQTQRQENVHRFFLVAVHYEKSHRLTFCSHLFLGFTCHSIRGCYHEKPPNKTLPNSELGSFPSNHLVQLGVFSG